MAANENALAPFQLDGKTALVTGAGSGLGRETARLLAAAGAAVAALDLNLAGARETAEAIGGRAIALEGDVSDEASLKAAFAECAQRLGDLDILINNAAYREKAGTMEMSVAEWDRMHAVNTRGSFICTREAATQMRRRGGGAIVNISSMSAARPTIFPNMHYDSSKAGIDAITRLAAVEFGPDNIRVNSVLPGGMITPGRTNIMKGNPTMGGPALMPGRVPLGRRADPIEVARAVLFLASPAASYITGVQLLVDGGFSVG